MNLEAIFWILVAWSIIGLIGFGLLAPKQVNKPWRLVLLLLVSGPLLWAASLVLTIIATRKRFSLERLLKEARINFAKEKKAEKKGVAKPD